MARCAPLAFALATLTLVGCGSSGNGGGAAPAEGGTDDGAASDAIEDQTTQDAPGDVAEAGTDAPPADARADGAGEAGLPACATDGGTTVLASGQSTPFWLAVDSTNVYWTTTTSTGRVMECAISDCCAHPVTLAAAQPNPSGVTVGGGNVYWITQGFAGPGTGSVASCPVSGCGGVPTTLVSGQGGEDLAVAGSTLFWSDDYSSADPSSGVMMGCSLPGCTSTFDVDPRQYDDAGAPMQPLGIAVDATNVYWADYGAGWVMAAPQNGSPVRTLATGQTLVRDLVVDANNVYWVTYEPVTVMQCPIAGCNGAPLQLYKSPSPSDTADSIAVDATNVYVTTSLGVLECAIGGCNGSPTVFASVTPGQYLSDIAVDGANVYWINESLGQILMQPK